MKFFIFLLPADEKRDIRAFVGDLCEPDAVEDAFKDVDTVFHCAGLISLQYPSNCKDLNRSNIEGRSIIYCMIFYMQSILTYLLQFIGTQSVVDLCIKQNVKRLIYTSCGSVCMVPFKGSSSTVVINQTESKASTPTYSADKPIEEFDSQFIMRGYSASKLRAEQIVLSAHGRALSNGTGKLYTTAIRPPLTYGEGDNHFMPIVMEYLTKNSYVYPRIAGAGGKQQLCYAGK